MNRALLPALACLLAIPLRAQEPTFRELLASDDPLAAVVGHVARREMEAGHVPGAVVAVARDGELVYAEGFGTPDLEDEGATVSPERTLFRVGSITKVFTLLALTQAVDRGTIGLEDAVQPRLGELAIEDPFDEPVRVRHLLTHTAGFDQIGTGRQVEDPAGRPTLAAFLEDQLRVLRPPGTVACYDTYGVTLAGHLLERLDGRPYAECVRARLLEPLGMTRTFVEAPEEARADLARGYGYGAAGHELQPYEWYVTLPASSIDATATDVAKLMLALLGDGSLGEGRILSPEAAARVRRPQHRDHPAIPGFTHGFWESDRYGAEHPVLHHGGTMRGYSAELSLFVDDGIGVFVACNRDGETGPYVNLHLAVVDAVFEVLLGEVPMGGPSEPELELDTGRFAGTWADTLYCHTCADGEGWPARPLSAAPLGPGVLAFAGRRWVALEPLLFRAQGGGDRLAFREDAEGRAVYAFTSNRSYERLR